MDRAKILAEARAHVAAFHAGNADPVVDVEPPGRVDLPPTEDRRSRSLRFYAQREADRQRAIRERRAEETKISEQRARASSDWDEWIAAKIAEVGFNERQQDVLARTIAAMRKEWRAEIGELRAEVNEQRSVDARERNAGPAAMRPDVSDLVFAGSGNQDGIGSPPSRGGTQPRWRNSAAGASVPLPPLRR
jgi:hypothetical protein